MCTKLILLKNPPFILREPAMWMSTTPTKERLPAIRGTAQGRHTDLGCAPLFWHKAPGSLSQATNHQEFVSPVLALVESFPGAMSPLGSKDSDGVFQQPASVLRSRMHKRHLPSKWIGLTITFFLAIFRRPPSALREP